VKRFYERAAPLVEEGGFALGLDGRKAHTPRRRHLIAPNGALADWLCDEWNAQHEVIDLKTMPLTRFLNAVCDLDPDGIAQIRTSAQAYVETDLISYQASEPSLAREQEGIWQPWRDWAGQRLGIALRVTHTIMPIAQPPEALACAHSYLHALPTAHLVATAQAMALLGSFVLGAALSQGAIEADAAFAASRVDEDYQATRWGCDEEAQMRAALLAQELAFTAGVLAALRSDGAPG
jgi:chaperone required for assembly of F1-ATPase